jgi:hypothetical protein
LDFIWPLSLLIGYEATNTTKAPCKPRTQPTARTSGPTCTDRIAPTSRHERTDPEPETQRGVHRTSRTVLTPYEHRTTHGPTHGPSTVRHRTTPYDTVQHRKTPYDTVRENNPLYFAYAIRPGDWLRMACV